MPDSLDTPLRPAGPGRILAYTGDVFRHNPWKHTVVFFFRSFWQYRLTTRWIAFIEDFSRRLGLGAPPLELVRKAFGAYFTLNHSLEGREALLEEHYRLAAGRLPLDRWKAFFAGESVELGRIAGKKDAYIVWLRRSDQCGTRHEGEWTGGFESAATGVLLCRITFILARDARGQPTVAIGGLQGPGREIPKTALVTATRDLGGLRPKDAMLLVAAGIARSLGAGEMLAIDNDSHPINYRAKRRRSRMLTDYDDYWRERGGVEGGPFGFVIPAKDPAEAEPGNKRRDEAKKAFFDCGFALLCGKPGEG
ncbi:DUF535 family protein [Gellertiella hungarica]|uniref:DUF535 domain-containing protein n=1 Tax=Gellertiella hungarica TaxID=1572859 RepID=A0A7W6J8Q2_9HYPH|nr:DUF535 family protein [Gellertiella hungarica]MBB4066822.1 hypothetical protein [Gellertiella hungarica]